MTAGARRRAWSAAALCCAVALSAVARAAEAQGVACPIVDGGSAWTPPLDRPVAQPASGLSLRTALDVVAARAGVRLSYGSDGLPLDREACIVAAPAPLGAVLTALLHGAPVRPLAGAATQVVLTPVRAQPPLATRTATLDRVVVTGSTAGAPERTLPYALDVVQPRTLHTAAVPTLAALLDGAVPGIWLWNDAPTTLQGRWASVRGASSFGVTAPKVFVDGVELANPLLLARLAGDAIERIEVIRGPQGAALYGADAISGVLHVQRRHEGAAGGGRELSARSAAGASATAYASGAAMVSEHLLALRAGRAGRSANVTASLTTTGPYAPGASATQLTVDAGARTVGARRITTAMASVRVADATLPTNPLLASLGGALGSGRLDRDQSLVHYTVGSTSTFTPGDAWTHQVTAGLDGYRLAGLAVDVVPVPSAVDSAARATAGGADRASVRASSVRRLALAPGLDAGVTLLGDAALLRDATRATLVPRMGPGLVVAAAPRWLSTVGVGVQGTLAVREALHLTAGVRGERNDGFTDASRFALLPTVGASWLVQRGAFAAKWRVAYGEGVRPARVPMRETAWQWANAGAIAADLPPERQAGVEAGVDLHVGRALSVSITRFDQRASSLIQQVPLVPGGEARPGVRRLVYRLENVGAIENRGWELGVRASRGTVAVQGTFALVGSTVVRVADGYSGDLRAGDRMLDVPARTAGVTVTWRPGRWTLQGGATLVDDWIAYDRLAVATDFVTGGAPQRSLTGEALRAYWVRHGAIARLRAAVVRDLGRGITVRATGENLGGDQRGEPDNLAIVPGRTVTLGLGVALR